MMLNMSMPEVVELVKSFLGWVMKVLRALKLDDLADRCSKAIDAMNEDIVH